LKGDCDMKTFYLVGALSKSHNVMINDFKTEIDLTFADGMVGVLPVFESLESAEKYADGEAQIFAIQILEQQPDKDETEGN